MIGALPVSAEPSIEQALESHRKLIGQAIARHARVRVATRALIGRYARSIGARDPLRLDPTYISRSVWGAAIGYPTSLHCFDDTLVAPTLAGYQRIYGACDWQFFQPLREGDAIASEAKLTSVEVKDGHFAGQMLVEEAEITYTNQSGGVVAIARPTILQTRRSEAVERGKYAGLGRHHYDGEALEKIWEVYEAEAKQMQGQKPRYWEEVSEADELGPNVKGPLVLEDLNSFVGLVSGTKMYGDWVQHMREHPEDVYWDPDTGLPDTWQSGLLTDKIAQAYGFPSAHDTGTQRIAWLDNLVSNWIGDFGFVQRLSVRLSEPVLVSDTTWCHGAVVSKSIDGTEARVALRLWCVSQRGTVTATGSAEVLLPSRRLDIPAPLFSEPKATEPRL